MTKIIAFAVDKGGTGKTTTAVNTAAGLAAKGYKVLAVDTDQQANMTKTYLPEPPDESMYDSLIDESTSLPVIKVRTNLDLVPASSRMFGVGIKMIENNMRRQALGQDVKDYRLTLSRLLAPIEHRYDVVLIDCPPSDNIMTFNALFMAEDVVIVANPEPYCVDAVRNFCDIIRAVRGAGHQLNLMGVLVTNVDTGSKGHKLAEETLRKLAPKHVFMPHIRHSWPIYNAALAHTDIFEYAPESNGAKDYAAFVEELISKMKRYEQGNQK